MRKQILIVFLALFPASCALTGRPEADISQAHKTEAKRQETAGKSLEALLDAILSDMVTADDRSRDFYGTPGDREIVLVNSAFSIPWPESYGPKDLGGWRIIPESRYTHPSQEDLGKVNRKLGIRIDLLCINPAILDSRRGDPFFGPITVTVFNVGGDKNGAVIGGGSFYYSAEIKDGKWVVEYRGGLDP